MESSVASAIMLKAICLSQVEIDLPSYCASSIVLLVHSFYLLFFVLTFGNVVKDVFRLFFRESCISKAIAQ